MIPFVGVVAFCVFYVNWCDLVIDGRDAPNWKAWTAAAAEGLLIWAMFPFANFNR